MCVELVVLDNCAKCSRLDWENKRNPRVINSKTLADDSLFLHVAHFAHCSPNSSYHYSKPHKISTVHSVSFLSHLITRSRFTV
jgi:hypothetical protein